MNLVVNLNSESIDAAVRKLEEYERSMEDKCNELSKRLGELGMDVLQTTYIGAQYAGTNDISVRIEPAENRCRIIASGSTLGFIEFGTGVDWPLGEYASEFGAPAHGTYGQLRGSRPGKKWVYKGDPGNLGQPDEKRPGLVWTNGNPPADAFPKMVQELQKQVEDIAKEVFRFD